MARSRTGLVGDSRGTLQDIVAKRLDAERSAVRPIDRAQDPYSSATDFSTLPGMQELKLGRSAVDFIGLANPFFRVHDGRASARTSIAGKTYSNFSSYDYLGLNGHSAVTSAAQDAIAQFGSSCSASRLVAGERPLHGELERALADHYDQEDAVVFVSGHATNVTVISAILGAKDLIVHDSLAHNSIVLGATLSGATRRSFPHNDANALDRILSSCRAQYDRVLIVAEGLYSMDGDCADLPALIEVKQRNGAWLMVDDAHALGVIGPTGKGSFEHHRVDPTDIDIWMGTLSKTLSACGGYVAGNKLLIEYLKFMSGGFVYSVGLPPAMAAAASASLRLMNEEPERVARLQRNAALFWTQAKARGFDVGTSQGHAIIPIVVHSSLAAGALSQRLFEKGINVQPIIHPAVPERHARLRFFLSAEHSADQIVETIKIVGESIEAGLSFQSVQRDLGARRET